MTSPRALITNDDGIDSPGLVVLAAAARDAGYEPVVAAPSWDSSGASASLLATESDGKVLAEKRRIGESDGQGWAIEAAPAFIVRAAMAEAFGPAPEVVLSGVNRGANLGHVVLHSGTVGAALTASTYGLPSIAASLEAGDRWHWATGAAVLAIVLPALSELDGVPCLNLNIPPVPLGELQGLAAAELAPFGAVQSTVAEAGAGWLSVCYEPSEGDHRPGTDAALLRQGLATITPLRGLSEAPLAEVEGVVERASERLGARSVG